MIKESRYIKSKNIAWRKIAETVFVVTPKDSTLHQFNEQGMFIWELLDGKNTTEEISASLAGVYDVDQSTVLADALDFLELLSGKGIVEKK
ncbi:MAG: PqqD family protein [Elusimicrobiota bacterium]